VKKRSSELSKATLKYLQDTFKHVRYLVIDEKLMIDLKQLSLIEARLQQIFPSRRMEPFGGLNILICDRCLLSERSFNDVVAVIARQAMADSLPLRSGIKATSFSLQCDAPHLHSHIQAHLHSHHQEQA
jgi:hypothetical protein